MIFYKITNLDQLKYWEEKSVYLIKITIEGMFNFKIITYKNLLFLVTLLISSTNWAQSYISGKVVDSNSGNPLAFANLIFNKNNALGTYTDIDGNFSYSTSGKLNSITCIYVGYKKKIYSPKKTKGIIIEMEPAISSLSEVVIQANGNLATKIIKKAVAHKAENDPKNIKSFTYRSYSKTIFNTKPVKLRDTADINNKNRYIFLLEDISKTKYKKPNFSQKTILASKVSGFKNPPFALFARKLQPFSFYEDNVELFDQIYLNPISDLGIRKYKFKLENKLIKSSDTIYTISFQPLADKNIDGLSGVVRINSKKFAIQSIRASIDDSDKINFTIKQKYVRVDGENWFPEQLNYKLEFNGFPSENNHLYAEAKSYIDNIRLNVPLKTSDFSNEEVITDPEATSRDSIFWEKARVKKLSQNGKNTYKVLDSIGEENNLNTYLSLLEKLSQNKIQVGNFDFDLSKTFVYNQYEGLRIGTGIYTNENLLKKFVFGGYFGYGLKDKAWKYGISTKYKFKQDAGFLKIGYENTLIEAGSFGINIKNKNLFGFRRFIGFKYDNVEAYNFSVEYKFLRDLKSNISFHRRKIRPKFTYAFENNGIITEAYNTTSFDMSFTFGNLETNGNIGNYVQGNSNEDFNVSLFYERGISDFLNSDFSYNKLETNIIQSFYTPGLGKTSYRLEAGYIDSALPFGLLFTGEGGFDKNYPFVGYLGSICASDFGFIVPGISVQLVPILSMAKKP
jgi:hypothetical protein